MITAMLVMVVTWCMFYGKLHSVALALLCAGLGAAFLSLRRHEHTQFLAIDMLAQVSRLKKVNPSLKFWGALALMAICISSNSPVMGIFLFLTMSALIVYIGGLEIHIYAHVITLPVSFLLVSGLALLFDITQQHTGIFGVKLFNLWFCVSADSQAQAALVVSRALGAVSCLYLLSLSTPMSEIIGVMRRARCPAVLIELMYLIYRYIFILLNMYHTMRNAAKSRLGYRDYRTSVSTTGNLYSNLLSRSYRQANRNFDAMESRCYNNEIRFLENTERVTAVQATAATGILLCTLGLLALFG